MTVAELLNEVVVFAALLLVDVTTALKVVGGGVALEELTVAELVAVVELMAVTGLTADVLVVSAASAAIQYWPV